jgi:hypothetical protein
MGVRMSEFPLGFFEQIHIRATGAGVVSIHYLRQMGPNTGRNGHGQSRFNSVLDDREITGNLPS